MTLRWIRFVVVLGTALALGRLAPLSAAGAEITSWPLGYYGQATGRVWQRLAVPDAVCGNGTPYTVFVSPGPTQIAAQPNRRIVIWMEGGGSTQKNPLGQVQTSIHTLGEFQSLLNANVDYDGATSLFMDHAANDLYIGAASWVFFPYCTQDVHLGERSDAVRYDMTSQQPLFAQVQALLNLGQTPAQIEATYIGLDVVAAFSNGSYTLENLYVDIRHRGALDVAAGWQRALQFFEALGFQQPNDFLIGGTSAGSYGAWYNAWRFVDASALAGPVRVTLTPSAGQPNTRRWDGQDLSIDQGHVLGVQSLFAYYQGRRSCQTGGGGYVADPNATCDDVLELVAHYTSRWPGVDVEVMPILNKEDAVVIEREYGGLPEPQFSQGVLEFCQTTHRYGQLIWRIDHARPYFPWQYQQSYALGSWSVDRVHAFGQSLLLEPMLAPAGQTVPAAFGLLETINRLAARVDLFKSGPSLIQTVAGLDPNLHDPAAKQEPYKSEPYLPECNVAWPAAPPLWLPAILANP